MAEIIDYTSVWLRDSVTQGDFWFMWATRKFRGNFPKLGWRTTQKQRNKQSGESHQYSKTVQTNGSYQAAKTSEEDANKNSKNRNKNLPVCPLCGPLHDMNSCKLMQAQAKAMSSTWSISRGGGGGRVQFQGTKKHPAEGQKLNTIVVDVVKYIINKKYICKIYSCARLQLVGRYGQL